MLTQVLCAIMVLVLASCAAPSMRWERPGSADAAEDEAACRGAAKREAAWQLPYGDGPPIFGVRRQLSFLEWKMAIDNQRFYLEQDLTRVCMLERGYRLVSARLHQAENDVSASWA
jgi:hypothetical protein